MMTRRVGLKVFGLVALGFVVGVIATVGVWLAANRHTDIYTTTTEVRSEGIVIPAGTELLHETFMSEGYDVLQLTFNVNTVELEECFAHRRDERYATRYWIEPKAVESSTAAPLSSTPAPGQ